jgi:dihydropteroate synthase
MGILNCTPDSFYDGGRYTDSEKSVQQALRMIGEGADFIDVGGESTRPGSEPVEPAEQIRRTLPVIEAIRKHWDGPVSIDTTRAVVAGSALSAGANWINDVSALRDDPEMTPLIVRTGAGIILMHMRGMPRNMQASPHYDDVLAEVAGFLHDRAAFAGASGIPVDRIVIDPGIGFGKTLEHNLTLLRNMTELTRLGYPVLIGASRKSFIGRLLGDDHADRLEGSLATAISAAARGASILRVHDVAPTRRALRVWSALAEPPQ